MDHPGTPKPTATFPPDEVATLLRSIMRKEVPVTLLGGEAVTINTCGHVGVSSGDAVVTFFYDAGGALKYIESASDGKGRWGDYTSWRRDFRAFPDNELSDDEFGQLGDFIDTLKPALPVAVVI